MSETMQTRASRASRAAANVVEDATEAVTTLRTEVPSSLVDVFEKSVARAKDAHEKAASIMEHSTEALEEAFTCANRGHAEYRAKIMEITRTNANLAFDLARERRRSNLPVRRARLGVFCRDRGRLRRGRWRGCRRLLGRWCLRASWSCGDVRCLCERDDQEQQHAPVIMSASC